MGLLISRISITKKDIRSYNEGATRIIEREGALEDIHALQSALTQARQAHEAIQMLIGLLTAEELRKIDKEAARPTGMNPNFGHQYDKN